MADAAVEFLLDNLKQLLLHYGSLIANARPQVEKLEKDLRLLNAFLKDTTNKRRKSERMRELIREIRDVVYEAEDTVDTFVSQAAEGRPAGRFFKRVRRTPANFIGIAKQVEDVSAKVKQIYGDKSKVDFALINVADADDPADDDENEAPIVRQENIVGFDDEANKLIGYLNEETEQLDVISIIGMPGLGKTTLAGKIYRDWRIQYGFPTRIWVYVSQEFTRRSVFLQILREFTALGEDMSNTTDQELAQMVASHLEKDKFLIVMDDVWSAEDWDKLRVALPTSNKMGKVLITSRQMEVGRHANCQRAPHSLRFLTEEESWLLLRYEVFGRPEFPNELEPFGRSIVNKCDNLPLAIVVIAGILTRRIAVTEDMIAVRNTWRKVSQNVNAFIVAEDPTKRMEKIIALSYDKLPYHLRACFLYLGMFPEDFGIPAWKLTRMWTAEGFIQRKDGFSLEDTAENYLDELINRNLLRVDKRSRDGTVKTCRIHDMLRDFCRTEAGSERENFFQEVKRSRQGRFDPPIASIQQSRRLCIHSNVTDFVSAKPFGPRVRSFVYFSKEEINLPAESTSVISESFKLLRVLEVQPIKFHRIPKGICQLFHLRYITISFDLADLPEVFSKLWNIETLIVDTKNRTLNVKADIWKMKQLRHFKTNASAILPKLKEPSDEGENIQSLGTISPQSCTEGILGKARYVKSLGIRGRLALLLEPRNGSLDSLGKLDKLEKLKLINDVFPTAASENPLPGLPQAYQFPENLTSLTLADTFLDWCHMSSLGLLYNLEILKLKDKAFMGDTWEAVDGTFRKLEVLYIGRTNLVTWTALEHHFPRLRSLELRNCEELQQIPIGLADIPNFKVLDLYRTTTSATASARRIQERKRQLQEEQAINSGAFKLSIFPPEE